MKTNLFVPVACMLMLFMSSCASQPVTAERIISAFKNAGLEAENTRPMSKEEYGTAPQVCHGTRFFIPSLGSGNGGRIFICDNTNDRDALTNYYNGIAAQGSIYVSWVFVKGNVVVQINGQLPDETAKKYEAAIP
jgi:hypothetical protein